MDAAKREALEAAGFRVGDAGDFLGLSDTERQIVELRVALARLIRQFRQARDMSQKQLAAKIGSSQPRVARIESAAADVSLDQMFRGLFAVGGDLSALAGASGPPANVLEAPKHAGSAGPRKRKARAN